jgi:uncharacterized protein (DUF2147 family)
MKIALNALLAVLLFPPFTAQAEKPAEDSIWRNPQNSVHVRLHPCGKSSRCGTVVWANAKARADSARGGTPNLVGIEIFREFQKVNATTWKGKVFVPDVNRVFTGTVKIENINTIVARGCLMGRIGCKSQSWTRVK